jgi:hypothetical protein
METKEAIECLGNILYQGRNKDTFDLIIKTHQITKLLKRGKKYEVILDKVKKVISSHSLIWLETLITELEKEHSLPIKKTITIEIEAKNEAKLKDFIGWFRSVYLDDIKIKEVTK